MKQAIWLAAVLWASMSASALAQQSGASAQTKSAGTNMTHCLKAEENKKDRMVILNNCGAPVNVVYCWKGDGGKSNKFSCAKDGAMERIDQGKRLVTRGGPKQSGAQIMFFGCESPASPQFTNTSGNTPQGVCKR